MPSVVLHILQHNKNERLKIELQKGDDENRGVDTSPMQPIFSFFQKEKKIEKKTVMQPGLSTCNHLFHVTLTNKAFI